jgi:O-methyltransferase domain
MTSLSGVAEAAIVAGYDFRAVPTIVDVGGGYGGMLATILAATPTVHGVLYDQPDVVAGAPTLLKQRGVDDRVRIEEVVLRQGPGRWRRLRPEEHHLRLAR